MPDNLTKAQRSYCMSRNRGKDTSIEVRVRSQLHRKGYRFRKHVANLVGKPDIVFTKAKLAIFIDGDFWHGYRLESWENKLSQFWRHKIQSTRKRDARNRSRLRALGWTVLRIWQHEIEKDFDSCIARIEKLLE